MKKKILMIALAACLITLSIAGTSLAYFTDTDAKTNVFASGNVEIELTYTAADTKLYPGQTYDTPATIKNTGSEEAYVGAIIDVTVPAGVTKQLTTNEVVALFDGLNADATTKCVATANGYKIYVILGQLTTANNDKTVTVFNKMLIPATWDHAQMENFQNMTVVVTGYAIQTVGLNGTVSEFMAAFTDWENYPNP